MLLSYDLLTKVEKKNLAGYEEKYVKKHGHANHRVYSLTQNHEHHWTESQFEYASALSILTYCTPM